MPIVGSQVIQHCRCHQPIALRATGGSRLTVSAADSAGTRGSAGSSMTGTAGRFAPRRAQPVGAGCPATVRPHVVSEMPDADASTDATEEHIALLVRQASDDAGRTTGRPGVKGPGFESAPACAEAPPHEGATGALP
ncbi:hypothetical protein ABTY20_06105 [Streptomyces sp. NPDC126497]|uniref:hypothetical protein n=1 Tax=Streptomyces sp. NPDC126497 TaxID=3155313 RepID=UPI00332611B2